MFEVPANRDPARSSLHGVAALEDTTKSERVVGEIERRILAGELASGEKLPTEGELGELLGVSRSVIRDAVRTLVARGLLTVRQGRGTVVAEPNDVAFGEAMLLLLARSPVTMGDVVEARAAIESQLVTLASRNATAADVGQLEASLEAFSDGVVRGDWERARSAHLEFHLGLIRAVGLPALTLLLRPMTEIIVVSSAPPRLEAKEDWEVATHGPILEAVRAGDAVAAERAMQAHFAVMIGSPRYKRFCERSFQAVFAEVPWARAGGERLA